MTFQEFDTQAFGKGMKVFHCNEEWIIAQVDFSERLLGLIRESDLDNYMKGFEQPTWARCENCTLLKSELNVQVSDTTKAQ